MKTPIFDFIEKYATKDSVRLHMPAHKGEKYIGVEPFDITEIQGADSLYHADGIIAKSEKNASKIFGANTFYSTEGSSLCIRTMVYLAVQYATENGGKPLILAGRNAHKSFINSCALCGAEVNWIYPQDKSNYLECNVSAEQVEKGIIESKPIAVYLTSPDYLGNILDVESIAKVCKKHGVLLMVDNAHGSYLKFLEKSLHPIDLGADMCSDSAHKTLFALTGGAYLHLRKGLKLPVNVKSVMALFGSTSPSYLTLASLDITNLELSKGYDLRLKEVTKRIHEIKQKLISCGYSLVGNEPLKLTIETKKYGYSGEEFYKILSTEKIECEYFDSDVIVMMFSTCNHESDFEKVEKVLLSVRKRSEIDRIAPKFIERKRVMSIRDAVMAKKRVVKVNDALGKVLAFDSVSCPPAVPIVVCGEKIDQNAIECFVYYGIEEVTVVEYK
ncbi:MAG: aminotransferase class V-fold PLP-dependent enzyme [Clostridiales bacterium]|nr:aminotransferase class V-fold PLP-dependent enzyme [Clostridiales bacterium]